ncbi:hypothetical protein TEA_009236 [Camellia sinensis var. sinensis]|uniref:Uncharacterized protein n=1 Tax=Camellia sinensis var. sinensis TaxID=542762 RepID=A0A4S4EP62_CAMSN|nr:hypothetical protein TEA_009236 [Camellia sinensis var. sinensis]
MDNGVGDGGRRRTVGVADSGDGRRRTIRDSEIPLVPSSQNLKPGVIFVLDKASLMPAYIGRLPQNDVVLGRYRKVLQAKATEDPDSYVQTLLEIMSSRLCMAGGVQAIYIKTIQGVLIKYQSKGKGEKLMRLIENLVAKHLPLNSRIIGLSFSSEKAVSL